MELAFSTANTNKCAGAGLVPARIAAGNRTPINQTIHRATHDPGRDEPCPYKVIKLSVDNFTTETR